jgi:hypothetical protein
MNTNKYQVWEGEMEAAGLEENGVSFFAAFFSAMLGLLLFIVLICRSIVESVFKIKFGIKKNTAPQLTMSVS